MICPMTNHYQVQSAAVDKRIKELEEAKRNDDIAGMNLFVYDHLLAVNKDLRKLYSELAQTNDAVQKMPAAMADAKRRVPSGR
jgi:hypothetical protein